jgi:hypothetical protein
MTPGPAPHIKGRCYICETTGRDAFAAQPAGFSWLYCGSIEAAATNAAALWINITHVSLLQAVDHWLASLALRVPSPESCVHEARRCKL